MANAGASHLVLPVASRETLAGMAYDFERLRVLMARLDWTTVQVVWAEAADRYYARDPFPVGGVVEDPATGAAAAALGGYLMERGVLTPPATFTVRQGEDLGRPSLLSVAVTAPGAGVRVTGHAVSLP